MKVATIAVALLFALPPAAGCGKKNKDKKEPATAPEAAATPPDAAPVRRARTVTNDEALAAIKACWSDGADACRADGVVGAVLDAVPADAQPGALLAELRSAAPDLTLVPQLIVVNGSSVAAVLLAQGTVSKPVWGQGRGKKKLSMFVGLSAQVGGDDVDGEIDARVTREEYALDQATVLGQVGVPVGKSSPKLAAPWPEPAEVMASNDDGQKTNFVAFNRGYLEAMRQRSLDGIAAAYTPDAVLSYVPEAGQYTGAREIRGRVAADFAASPDLTVTVRRQWGAGDWVVFESIAQGTLAKPDKREAAGKDQKWSSKRLELLQYRDGKIYQHWIFANDLHRAVQLGLFDAAKLKVAAPAPK